MNVYQYFSYALKACVFDKKSIHALRKDKNSTFLSISLIVLSVLIMMIFEWFFNKENPWWITWIFTPAFYLYVYISIYILVRLFGSKESYLAYLRIDGPVTFLFGTGLLLQYVPIIGSPVFFILGLWNLILIMFIITEAFKLTWGKTIGLLAIIFGVFFILMFIAGITLGFLAYFGVNPLGLEGLNATLPMQ